VAAGGMITFAIADMHEAVGFLRERGAGLSDPMETQTSWINARAKCIGRLRRFVSRLYETQFTMIDSSYETAQAQDP